MLDAIPFGPCGRLGFFELVVVDTETTGLAPFGRDDKGLPTGDPHGPDRLCSLAALRLHLEEDGWRIVDEASWTTDPQRPVPEVAAAVNGFAWSPDGSDVANGRTNLAGSQTFDEIAPHFRAFAGERPLVFHNAVFDMAVLDAELLRAGLPPLANPVLCTKKAFADMQGLGRPDHYIPGTNLNKLCDLLGVDRSSRIGTDGQELHGAAVDARLAALCLALLEPRGWMIAEAAATLPHRRAGWTVPTDMDALLRRAPRQLSAGYDLPADAAERRPDLSYDAYRTRVNALAVAILAEAGDAPAHLPGADIFRVYGARLSVMAAAHALVATVRQERQERGPYGRQEQRVCEYLTAIMPDIGCGMDPVGFLLASHAALVEQSSSLRAQLDAHGLTPDDLPG